MTNAQGGSCLISLFISWKKYAGQDLTYAYRDTAYKHRPAWSKLKHHIQYKSEGDPQLDQINKTFAPLLHRSRHKLQH